MNNKQCQKCKKEFNISDEDMNFYQMVNVPAPTFCPECRFIRRLSFRNDRTLFKHNCDMCKKDVISVYRPNGGQKIVCQKCWWSDDFNPSQYARDYDPNVPFLKQFKDLMNSVPFIANFIVDESRMVNSPYNNMVLDLRNCYMMFNSDFDEDCSYGCEVENSLNCVDTNLIDKSEMCYESVNLQNCYRAFYSVDCESSSDIWFCRDCTGCTDCFGCINLRKQSYCIYNEPMGTKEAYQARLAELGVTSRAALDALKPQIAGVWDQGLYKYMHEKQNEDSTGDYIYNSRNVTESWIVYQGWNLKYCQYLVAPNVKDSYDLTQFGNDIELHYDTLVAGNGGSRVRFCWWATNENQNLDYCIQVMTSHDLFGCIGMRKKQYCILNKEYSPEEYEKLRADIIQQMTAMPYKDAQGISYPYGEFFPTELSPFAYNETSAQEIFPLTPETVKDKGFTWAEREARNYQPTLTVDKIPDSIEGVGDEITKDIIQCANMGDATKNCATAFRIIPDELGFYRRFNIPLPAKCPNCRHAERMVWRNPPKFRKGKCAAPGCGVEFLTAYAEGASNIYCKEHYLQTVS